MGAVPIYDREQLCILISESHAENLQESLVQHSQFCIVHNQQRMIHNRLVVNFEHISNSYC